MELEQKAYLDSDPAQVAQRSHKRGHGGCGASWLMVAGGPLVGRR